MKVIGMEAPIRPPPGLSTMHSFDDPDQTQSLPPGRCHPSGNGDGSTPPAMQADHASWHACLVRWKEDAATWQAEHDALLERLAEMQRCVVEHGTSLHAHEAACGGIELSLAELEKLGAIPPGEGHPGPMEALESRRRDLSARVRQVDDAHRRMAKHHADVVARMTDLERATSAPL